MADDVSTALSLFANYSNFYSVMSVLICFCIMVVFILRLNGDNLVSSSATHYNTVKEQPMVSLHNPFSVQLDDLKLNSLTGGLNLMISVTSPSRVCAFWGVNIQSFQKELQLPNTDIPSRYQQSQLFDGAYLHKDDCDLFDVTELPVEIQFQCPTSVDEQSLGTPPRQVYPVVIVTLLQDCDIPYSFTAIVAQFTVFHLKDSSCPLDSHIVYQFVKTNQDSILSLQPIFLSTSNGDTPDSSVTAPSQASETVQTNNGKETGGKTTCMERQDSSKETDTSPEIGSNTTGTLGGDGYQHHLEELPTGNNRPNEEAVESHCELNTDSSDFDETNSCIVCQSAVIFYTLLPCRHACVCSSCIKQLDRCPMCRGYIDAYFRLNDEDEVPELVEDEREVQVRRLNIWHAFNERLNNFLGFT